MYVSIVLMARCIRAAKTAGHEVPWPVSTITYEHDPVQRSMKNDSTFHKYEIWNSDDSGYYDCGLLRCDTFFPEDGRQQWYRSSQPATPWPWSSGTDSFIQWQTLNITVSYNLMLCSCWQFERSWRLHLQGQTAQELLLSQHRITSHKTWIFNNTNGENLKFHKYSVMKMHNKSCKSCNTWTRCISMYRAVVKSQY